MRDLGTAPSMCQHLLLNVCKETICIGTRCWLRRLHCERAPSSSLPTMCACPCCLLLTQMNMPTTLSCTSRLTPAACSTTALNYSLIASSCSIRCAQVSLPAGAAGREQPQLAAHVRLLHSACTSQDVLPALAAAHTCKDRLAALAALDRVIARPDIALEVAQARVHTTCTSTIRICKTYNVSSVVGR